MNRIIKSLQIGQWGPMNFIVGDYNRTFGRCESIAEVFKPYKENANGITELRYIYRVLCIKDNKGYFLEIEPTTSSLVVIYEQEIPQSNT